MTVALESLGVCKDPLCGRSMISQAAWRLADDAVRARFVRHAGVGMCTTCYTRAWRCGSLPDPAPATVRRRSGDVARSRRLDRWVDDVAVERVLAGRPAGRALTRAERQVVAERVCRAGGGAGRLAEVLRCSGTDAARLAEEAQRRAGMPVTIDRALCPAKRHGTEAAYGSRPGCRCPDARAAHMRGTKRRRLGLVPPDRVDTVGLVRRRQALGVLGWSLRDLAPYFGCSAAGLDLQLARPWVRRASYRKWAAVYERLCRLPGPNPRVRAYASRHGWLPPGAWTADTIDDPHALPQPRYRLARAG